MNNKFSAHISKELYKIAKSDMITNAQYCKNINQFFTMYGNCISGSRLFNLQNNIPKDFIFAVIDGVAESVLGYSVDEDGEIYNANNTRAGEIYVFDFYPNKTLNESNIDTLPDSLNDFQIHYKAHKDISPTGKNRQIQWIKELSNLGYDCIDLNYIDDNNIIILNPNQHITLMTPESELIKAWNIAHNTNFNWNNK